MPRRASVRHNPVTTSDFPASEDVPAIRTPLDSPVSVPTGEVYGVSRCRPSLAGTAPAMFVLHGLLSNRDFGGRRARRRQRNQHKNANRLCECCDCRQRSSRRCCPIWQFGPRRPRFANGPGSPARSCSGHSYTVARVDADWRHYTIQSGACALSSRVSAAREAVRVLSRAEASFDCHAG